MARNKIAHTDYNRHDAPKSKRSTFTTCTLILAIIIVSLGVICVGVGVGLPAWINILGTSTGIFQFCTSDLNSCVTLNSLFSTLEYRSGVLFVPLVWGLVLGGCVALLFAIFFMCFYLFYSKVNHCKMAMAILFGIFTVLAVTGILTGMAVYLDYIWSDVLSVSNLSYGFYITASGLLLLIIGLVCFTLHTFFLYKDNEGVSRY